MNYFRKIAVASSLLLFFNSPICAQAQASDEGLSLALGARLFDSVCRASIGNPEEFHRLIAATELTPIPQDQTSGIEAWAGSVGGVSVAVQYTRVMTCSVYMSHAKEEDVRLHIIKLIKMLTQQGIPITSPPTSSNQSKDSSVLRFNVNSPQGKFMLMALYRPGAPPSLTRAALVVGPFN